MEGIPDEFTCEDKAGGWPTNLLTTGHDHDHGWDGMG